MDVSYPDIEYSQNGKIIIIIVMVMELVIKMFMEYYECGLEYGYRNNMSIWISKKEPIIFI